MIDKLINWWCNWDALDEDEMKLAKKLESKDIDYLASASEIAYVVYETTLTSMMPWSSINNPKVSFASSCTNLIDAIFSDIVTDNTLVITTSVEHNSVRENLKKCKNVIELDYAIATLKNNKLKEFITTKLKEKTYSNVLNLCSWNFCSIS